MNDQPVISTSSSPFSSGSGSGGGLSFVLLAVLGLGALVFLVLTVVFYSKYSTQVKTVDAQKTAAAKAAAAQQLTDDGVAATKANESPFRAYVAPDAYGSFVINFPKDWSSWVDSEQSGTQVELIMNPNFVTKTNGQEDLAAARVTLQEQTGTLFMTQFSGGLQQGQLHQSNIVVSGQQGYDVTGTFPDRRTIREVVVPVRDKVLVFSTENSKYSDEFNEILAQAKINP